MLILTDDLVEKLSQTIVFDLDLDTLGFEI